MNRLIFLFLAVCLLATLSCDNKYPGYKKSSDGFYYKLLAFDDSSKKTEVGDYITVDISYKTINDSLFFRGQRKLKLTKPEFEGSIDYCFAMLSKGDKAEFIINANNFFIYTLQKNLPTFLKNHNEMKVDVEMLDVQSETDYENQKKSFLKWVEDFGQYEKEVLSQYIQQNKINIRPTSSGLYFISINPGKKSRVNPGDTVIVDYEGKFLDGKFFDSTKKRHESFQFVYGTEWQVIKGLEEAIGMMGEGEKAIVIVPSDMAFGTDGSSTGIIPPFTSLIFEVELVKIIPGGATKRGMMCLR